MERMRDVLRRNLGRALEAMPDMDRLRAAWPVACGPALAGRAEIIGFDQGIVRILVQDEAWLDQLRSMRAILERELGRIAGVPVHGIHFEQAGKRSSRSSQQG